MLDTLYLDHGNDVPQGPQSENAHAFFEDEDSQLFSPEEEIQRTGDFASDHEADSIDAKSLSAPQEQNALHPPKGPSGRKYLYESARHIDSSVDDIDEHLEEHLFNETKFIMNNIFSLLPQKHLGHFPSITPLQLTRLFLPERLVVCIVEACSTALHTRKNAQTTVD